MRTWETFWADVENTSEEGGVRVFLAGSIFGGTGAAGIPTLGARGCSGPPAAVLGDRSDGRKRSKVRLGAALVLPYFTFDPGTTAGPQMFVTAADFPIATKAALHYYQTKPLAFDDLYLVGDSLGQKSAASAPARGSRRTPPTNRARKRARGDGLLRHHRESGDDPAGSSPPARAAVSAGRIFRPRATVTPSANGRGSCAAISPPLPSSPTPSSTTASPLSTRSRSTPSPTPGTTRTSTPRSSWA